MSIIVHNWNGFSIFQRKSDGFVCLTDMAKACGKNVHDYLRLPGTLVYIAALAEDLGVTRENLVFAKPGKNGGTWAHLEIAIDFAIWVSTKFRVWANRVLRSSLPHIEQESGDSELDSILESLGIKNSEAAQNIEAEPVQNNLFDENLNLRTVAEILKDGGVHPVVVLNFAMPIGMHVAKAYAVRFGKPPQHASWNNSNVYPNHFHGDVMNIACAYLKRKGVYI